MPGETFDDMLGAARAMTELGVAGVFTRLGENVKDLAEADEVAAHYLDGIDRVRALGLACEPSIKLTQLGLDIDREFAYAHAAAPGAGRARRRQLLLGGHGAVLLRRRHARPRPPAARGGAAVGVCLQAYLMRTQRGSEGHHPARGIGVRLVKGAYKEPINVAYPVKADVDENYYALAQSMLGTESRAAGSRAVFGTHDVALIARIRQHAAAAGIPPSQYEFHMLYGIQRAEQLRLAREGASVRVLIAYGSYWFPWYMRRLAERPANVWFVVKSLFG